jgi:aerobic-type carbon monoxide dehydrogenase small subunit (CoxS/CutS family)
VTSHSRAGLRSLGVESVESPDPTFEEVLEALASDLCRCCFYQGIAQAVLAAAAAIGEGAER